MKLSGKPSELERRLREAMALMRRGLCTGEEVSAEAILARYPELARHEDSAIDLIYGEFTIRAEMGQRPSPGAWLARFPAWRERIGRLLDLHEIFEDFDSGRGKSPDLVPPRLDRRTTRRFGRYDLQEVVGRGGEGIVYRAVERESGRTVALKLILEGVHAGARQRDQLRTAALACADLRHPNIVRVDEYGEEDGLPYLVLDYVAGRSLARAIGGRASRSSGSSG